MTETVDQRTGEILVLQQSELVPDASGFQFTPTGLVISGRPSYAAWEAVGKKLQYVHGAVHWWLGDWINEGEMRFGETYAQAIEDSPFTYGTLANDKFIAQQIECSRRREKLSFAHHAEVAKLAPDEQDFWLDQAEANSWTRQQLRQAIRDSVDTPPLPSGKYRVLYADPPWRYGTAQHTREGQETVLETHYSTMALEAICALPVKGIVADDAVLFLWATSPLLQSAFQVAEAWGFEYKAAFIWDKIKHNVGYYNSVRHEFLLICTRGSCLPDKKPEGEPVLFDSVVSLERSDEHSEKPAEFRHLIDTLYPSGPRIELFARTSPDGWDAWGAEV